MLTFFPKWIGLEFIDNETCPRMLLKIVCGPYQNQIYGFYPTTGLWKVVDRVMVECNWLLTSIDCFYWYQISFKLSKQYFFVYLWLVYITFTVSAFIDTESCPHVWLEIIFCPYPNQTYGFASPEGLWKVVSGVPVL